MATPETRSETLDIRLTPPAKRKLEAAAAAAGRTLSDFVLDCAMQRADEVLPDRRFFRLNAEQWQRFVEAMDSPQKRSPRLERLLREPIIFKRCGAD
ncbi:MAG: DUF1778 domain-containing protein [Bryobacteraceae bacterium]